MTASCPIATDEQTLRVVFANQHNDFHCHSDVHRRPLVVLPTFKSLRDNLYLGSGRTSQRYSLSYMLNLSFPFVPHHEFETLIQL